MIKLIKCHNYLVIKTIVNEHDQTTFIPACFPLSNTVIAIKLMRMSRFSGLAISSLDFLWVLFPLPSYLVCFLLYVSPPFTHMNIVSVSEPS